MAVFEDKLQRLSEWSVWVDRGGTFTDVVAHHSSGELRVHKLLSENPGVYTDAAVQGIKEVLHLDPSDVLSEQHVKSVKMGTTVATNALLERKGERTALLITRGFADLLEIAYQTRPNIFALDIEKPQPLYEQAFEIDERLDANGHIVIELNAEQAKMALKSAYDQGFRSIAIVLLHSYLNSCHEDSLADLARAQGFTEISVSSQISPLIKAVGRGDTTVVNAYLNPVLRKYVQQVSQELHGIELQFMQSHGGLIEAGRFQGKDAVLSGPAGGVVGMVKTAQQNGLESLIGFDMGGTSTDVSHFSGELERSFDTAVSGVRLRSPMMHIHTIAAGGGSEVFFDGTRMRVGPESAGAHPGPMSYRQGGPLTVTDCNVMLGKIQAQCFPKIFGRDRDQALDFDKVKQHFEDLAKCISRETAQSLSAYEVAEGFVTVAVDSMANAIKKVSLNKGYDLANYALCAFGGAGGQHACLVAENLGIQKIFIHRHASLLSAYGIGLAENREIRQQALEHVLDTTGWQLLLQSVEQLSESLMSLPCVKPGLSVNLKSAVHIKYQGSDTSLLVPVPETAEALAEHFHQQHNHLFGFDSRATNLWLASLQVELVVDNECLPEMLVDGQPQAESHQKPFSQNHIAELNLYSKSQLHLAQVFDWGDLPVGACLQGPALIVDNHSTIVVEPHWQAEIMNDQSVLLRRLQALNNEQTPRTHEQKDYVSDPVQLEIFNNLFRHIAEQMGTVLEQTAVSVNIKERLDFSCAIFNSRGDLIANAPHIPVHLGSMSDSVKTVLHQYKHAQAGDAYVLNTPYNGGTHLPDITVVKPVFVDGHGEPCFYVAARGHHADIGGVTPGSMPPQSRHIEEEGVLLDNLQVMFAGRLDLSSVETALLGAKYPARNISQNMKDLEAQLAACEKGVVALRSAINEQGLSKVLAYTAFVMDNAEKSVRKAIKSLSGGTFQHVMDDGSQVCVEIEIDQAAGTAVLDFTGTSDQHQGNFNAPSAVCRAAVLYVFRCIIDDDIPMNDGIFRALDLRIPEHSMLSPEYPAAVVAGNVETAQYLVDALMGALGIMASAQGTNNNLTFGNDRYQYYETLCGGAGAGVNFHGASAVHTHMTNSRLTDPEVLEQRYPVRLDSFQIRKGSGGHGLYNGGDGVKRCVTFLEPMQAAIISGHRQVPPFGLAGGAPGAIGVNTIIRSNGAVQLLSGCDVVNMSIGDTFVVETPGGGAYGRLIEGEET